MLRARATKFQRKCLTYLSRKPTHNFCSFAEFTGSDFPPSPQSIRKPFEDAKYSPLTPYGYSHVERYGREVQSVKVEKGERIAIDHIFATIKNYNLPEAKAIFTMNKATTKEVVTLAIVPTTGVKDIAHLITNLKQKRATFKPSLLYTDMCPANRDFWRTMLGANVSMRLGLFHLQHRIVETLDPICEAYQNCLTNLKNVFYDYNRDDLANLYRCLADGTFSNDQKKYSPVEICQLRSSKEWKSRCDPYLQKRINPKEVIQVNLKQWIVEFENAQDSVGRSVFTSGTKKTAEEQLKKVGYASDPPGMEMYKKCPLERIRDMDYQNGYPGGQNRP